MSRLSRIRSLFRREQLADELEEELRFHLEMRANEMIASGVPPEEARRRAALRFGNELVYRERSRDIKLLPWLESLGMDAAHGLRLMRKNPVVTLAAIVSLALAIGANTAVYSLVDAVILKPLPVHHPEQLVYLTFPPLQGWASTDEVEGFSYPLFERLRDAGRPGVDLFGASYRQRRRVSFGRGEGEDKRIVVQYISGEAFPVLGVVPAAGRTLTAEDDRKPGKHPVAVISYDFWTRRFGRDPAVIGKYMRVTERGGWEQPGTGYEVIGVAQRGFSGIEPGVMVDVWLPMMMWNPRAFTEPGWSWFRILGRLKPGAMAEQAQARLQPVFSQFRRERSSRFPADEPRSRVQSFLSAPIFVRPAVNGPSRLRRDFAKPLWIVVVVVALVLLIACANVANLLLARAAAREREMALRISIGAGRLRLVQQMLVESFLLAVIASLTGWVFALWGAPALVELLAPADQPVRLALGPDWRVLGFTLTVCMLTTMLFGLAPALRASGTDPNAALKGGDARQPRFALGKVLVAAQVGFSFLLIVAAGLFLLTLRNLVNGDAGFDRYHVVLADIDARDVGADAEKRRPIWRELVRQVRVLPGVESASLSEWGLFSGNSWTQDVRVPGRAPEAHEPTFLPVSPGFFETMRTPLLAGRDFSEFDRFDQSPLPVIVNEAFANRYFPGENPVGREFQRVDSPTRLVSQRVVGLVRSAKYDSLRKPAPAMVYVPFRFYGGATMQVRTRMEPWALQSALIERLRAVHPGFVLLELTAQSKLVDDTLVRERLLARLSGFFGVLALVLASVGLFGVLNYSVIRRTREIGIRMALGARAGHVIRLVFRDVLVMLGCGFAAGVAAAVPLTRFLESLLFGLRPADPLALALAAALLAAVALVASALPTLRALRVNPTTALRQE